MVKDILSKQECLGKKGRWITKIQEYDIKLRPTKLLRGQGLAKLMTEQDFSSLEGAGLEDQEHIYQVNAVLSSLELHEWYADIILYLKNLSFPNDMGKNKRQSLKLVASKYCLVQGRLGWRNPNGVILQCVDSKESQELLQEMHAGMCGGHFLAQSTIHKILRARHYWPLIHRDTHAYVHSCEPCQ